MCNIRSNVWGHKPTSWENFEHYVRGPCASMSTMHDLAHICSWLRQVLCHRCWCEWRWWRIWTANCLVVCVLFLQIKLSISLEQKSRWSHWNWFSDLKDTFQLEISAWLFGCDHSGMDISDICVFCAYAPGRIHSCTLSICNYGNRRYQISFKKHRQKF